MFFNESELREFKLGISGQFTVGNLERYRGDNLRVHIIANTIGLYISMFGRELTKQDGFDKALELFNEAIAEYGLAELTVMEIEEMAKRVR